MASANWLLQSGPIKTQTSQSVNMQATFVIEFYSDSRAGDVRFRSIPTPTPPGGSYVGGMVVKGVSKDCIFNEDFRYVLKFAVGAVVYELG